MTFKVVKIEGEYATLTSESSSEELFIAMALLPEGTDIGSVLLLSDMEFTLVK